jgi:hypothetical protein
MERLVEYLERAKVFDRLAVEEPDPKLRVSFEQHAKAYRKLTARRAKALGVELPAISN